MISWWWLNSWLESRWFCLMLSLVSFVHELNPVAKLSASFRAAWWQRWWYEYNGEVYVCHKKIISHSAERRAVELFFPDVFLRNVFFTEFSFSDFLVLKFIQNFVFFPIFWYFVFFLQKKFGTFFRNVFSGYQGILSFFLFPGTFRIQRMLVFSLFPDTFKICWKVRGLEV